MKITYNGVTRSPREWATETGLSEYTIKARIKLGWSPHHALTLPPHPGKQPGALGMTNTRTYKAWQRMKNRCNNPNATQWRWYGGRGISVCTQWDRFAQFFADMGTAPSEQHTIERIDNDGNYEPSNCRWATMREQGKNKRPRCTTVYLTYRDETLSVTEWAKKLGMPRHTIYGRIKAGWDVESILTLEAHMGMSPGGWRKLTID